MKLPITAQTVGLSLTLMTAPCVADNLRYEFEPREEHTDLFEANIKQFKLDLYARMKEVEPSLYKKDQCFDLGEKGSSGIVFFDGGKNPDNAKIKIGLSKCNRIGEIRDGVWGSVDLISREEMGKYFPSNGVAQESVEQINEAHHPLGSCFPY